MDLLDMLNAILNPEKIKATCFLCFKQKDETMSVFQKLFICDEYHSSDTTLADMMKYLFPSHDILCNQACEDCFKILTTTYKRLQRHNYLRETLFKITNNLTKKASSIILQEVVTKNVTIALQKSDLIEKYKKNDLNDEKDDKTYKSAETVMSPCNKCDMKFISEEILSQHYKLAHKNTNQAVVCEFCGKDCRRPSTLRAHLNCHKEKICTYCSKTLKSHSHYKIHLKNHKTKVIRSKKGRIYYSCNMCSYQSLNKGNLEAHKNKVHLHSRPYVCDLCNKGFFRKSNLTEHILIHEGVKNFTCELCGGEFGSKKTLTEHIRLHTGEKPYECEICNQRFVSSGRRTDHFKRRHMEKTNCCFLCDKKYSLKKDLNTHMKKIHGHSGNTEIQYCDRNELLV